MKKTAILMILTPLVLAYGSEVKNLKFSQTQKNLEVKIFEEDFFPKTLFSKVAIPAPPENDSQETQNEIKKLIKMKKLRTPKKIREIWAQRNGPWILGPFDMANFDERDPIHHYVRSTFRTVRPVTFDFKNKFDRVRPISLSSEIQPIVKTPNHAAYPSSHAAQAYIIAFALIDIAQEFKNEIMESANSIAINREIAGVHYKSDTLAGKSVASQVYEILKSNKDFLEFQSAAKKQFLEQKSEITKDFKTYRKYKE